MQADEIFEMPGMTRERSIPDFVTWRPWEKRLLPAKIMSWLDLDTTLLRCITNIIISRALGVWIPLWAKDGGDDRDAEQ